MNNEGTRFRSTVPVLSVADLARAVAFYERRLGFRSRIPAEGYAILQRDDIWLHMEQVPDHDPSTACGFRIQVDEIEPLFDACAATGIVHPRASLVTQPWGSREFGIIDPDGYLITFTEPAPAVIA